MSEKRRQEKDRRYSRRRRARVYRCFQNYLPSILRQTNDGCIICLRPMGLHYPSCLGVQLSKNYPGDFLSLKKKLVGVLTRLLGRYRYFHWNENWVGCPCSFCGAPCYIGEKNPEYIKRNPDWEKSQNAKIANTLPKVNHLSNCFGKFMEKVFLENKEIRRSKMNHYQKLKLVLEQIGLSSAIRSFVPMPNFPGKFIAHHFFKIGDKEAPLSFVYPGSNPRTEDIPVGGTVFEISAAVKCATFTFDQWCQIVNSSDRIFTHERFEIEKGNLEVIRTLVGSENFRKIMETEPDKITIRQALR